ncbi:MAG: cytidine deaminase [Clostridia bacterium]|nr:cytidine deaminase [Clostridia bacterium]
MEYGKLVEMAYEVMENAYVPYSKFNVGAALLTKSGKVYTGCNVECASYGATNCAERTAIFKAVSEGEREFTAIAIVSRTRDITFPCGICRQVLSEFADEMDVILAKGMEYKVYKLTELMPYAFEKSELNK